MCQWMTNDMIIGCTCIIAHQFCTDNCVSMIFCCVSIILCCVSKILCCVSKTLCCVSKTLCSVSRIVCCVSRYGPPYHLVCDTPNSLCDENKHLECVFQKNNFNADYIKWNIYRPSKADETNRNPTPVTTVTIPYIKGTSETISWILQLYNIRVARKPTTMLRHLLTNLKTETNPTTDREQFTRSNAPTARLPTLVRLAETLTWDWLTITSFYIINWLTTTLTGVDSR